MKIGKKPKEKPEKKNPEKEKPRKKKSRKKKSRKKKSRKKKSRNKAGNRENYKQLSLGGGKREDRGRMKKNPYWMLINGTFAEVEFSVKKFVKSLETFHWVLNGC